MADLIVEVDEAMKQERLEKLWKDYGGFVIGAITILIFGTAGNAGYKSWVSAKNQKETSTLLKALENKDAPVDDLVKISSDIQPGLRDLALLNAASKALETDEKDKAVSIYKELAQKEDISPSFKTLAEYMIITHSQELNAEEKIIQYAKIATNDQSPWRFQAKLDMALIKANKLEQYEEAIVLINEIMQDQNAPQSLRKKAQSLDLLYALKEKIQ